jgi:hypothetical protein
VIAIIEKLLLFLKAADDAHFKKDLVHKICSLSERFSPNQEWFLKTMNMVFEHGAEYVDSAILNNFLRLLNENFTLEGEDFAKQLVEQYIKTIQKSN